MTLVRFPVPYRPAEKGSTYRLGYARLEVPDVSPGDAPVAARMRALRPDLDDAVFRLHQGRLWRDQPLVKRGEAYEVEETVGSLRVSGAVASRIPALTGVPITYTRHDWDALPADEMDMHPDFVASETWKRIEANPYRGVFVEGTLYRWSSGPVFQIPDRDSAYAERGWIPWIAGHQLVNCFPFTRTDIADRICQERFGRLPPLRRQWSAPEFFMAKDKLPEWDGLAAAIEAVAAQAMASTNLLPAYSLSRSALRALVDLRAGLQERFPRPIDISSRATYALPHDPDHWNRPDARDLLERLDRYLALHPEARKRASEDYRSLRLRLKHEAHLSHGADFDDPELSLL